MYRNFCQAVLPLLFQVFYNFTIFFCVYARKRTFCVFIHKKRRKIVLLRKFLHKKIISRKEKIQRHNGWKLYLFLPPDGMRACLFPIFPRASDALSAEKRTMRTCFPFSPSLLLFSLSFAPFPSDGAAVPHGFAFFLFVLCFCLSFSHGSDIFVLGARWRDNVVLPSRCNKISPFNKQDPDFKKPFVPRLQTFSFGKNPHRFHDRRKRGDIFSPLSARDILYAECAATLSPAQNGCVIS